MIRNDIVIYGAGGLGREVASWILQTKVRWNLLGFCDDQIETGKTVGRHLVLGNAQFLEHYKEPLHVVIAVGNPLYKHQLLQRILPLKNLRFPVIIHPQAVVQDIDTVRLGDGCILAAGCILTTDIVVGPHVLINLNVTVGHDVSIGSGTSIMPGANIAGNVSIGEYVLVGSGSNVLNGVKIAHRAKVGAGAVVTKNVEGETTVVGIPAKKR